MKEGLSPTITKPITAEQHSRLHDWDQFISNIKIEKPMSLKERWEAKDKEFIAKRNKDIGWKK